MSRAIELPGTPELWRKFSGWAASQSERLASLAAVQFVATQLKPPMADREHVQYLTWLAGGLNGMAERARENASELEKKQPKRKKKGGAK